MKISIWHHIVIISESPILNRFRRVDQEIIEIFKIEQNSVNRISDIFQFADRKSYQHRLLLIFQLIYFGHEGWTPDLTSIFVIDFYMLYHIFGCKRLAKKMLVTSGCWWIYVCNNLGVFMAKFQYSWHRIGAWTLNFKRQRMFATKMTETNTKISKLSPRRLQHSSPTSPLRKIWFHPDILIVKKFHGLILVLSFDEIDANYLILIRMCFT